MITLRPYQVEAVEAIRREWAAGRTTALVMTMGLGKTETLLGALAEEYEEGPGAFRALIIAHRQELIYQPVDRIGKHWQGKLPKPGIVMADHDDSDAKIIVATIQTIARPGRLEAILAHGGITHVVIDEAHHAVAKTYRDVIDSIREANPGARVLGVTATPKRADGEALKKVFDSVAYRVGIKDAIDTWKSLSPFRAYGLSMPVDFADTPIVGGDYDAGAVGSLMSANNAIELMFESWQRVAGDRLTMVYTATVEQARVTAQYFQEMGVLAAWASGDTEADERKRILADFRSGKVQVVCNCMLWTEGLDVPEIACVVMARPTRSDGLYMQCVGRGLRIAEGKEDAIIIDCVPKHGRDLVLAGNLLGVPKEQRKREKDAEDKGLVAPGGMRTKGTGIDGDPDEVVVEVLDLLSGQGKSAPLSWTVDGVWATASISMAESVCVALPDHERRRKAMAVKEKGTQNWSPATWSAYEFVTSYHVYAHKEMDRKTGTPSMTQWIGSRESWSEAVSLAEDYGVSFGDSWLAKKDRKWRGAPPSEGQQKFAKRLGVWQDGMSRGRCAQAITHKLTVRAAEKIHGGRKVAAGVR